MLSDIRWYLKLLGLIKIKALMIKINVITNNAHWLRYIKSPTGYIDRKIKKLNIKNKIFKKNIIFCTLLLSNNKEIRNLNKKFRKKNKTTDVLSFPFYSEKNLKKYLKKEKEVYLGDIIINLNKVNSKKNLKLFKTEFDKLWIHGLVHLFGYNHKKAKDFKKLNQVEKNYLKYIK
jgi:probable rRNA maturation factor